MAWRSPPGMPISTCFGQRRKYTYGVARRWMSTGRGSKPAYVGFVFVGGGLPMKPILLPFAPNGK